ncbi:DUF1499 domain-containing protein [Shimia sagamensis]|uniref:DUF1499 domain-containing protein n=1 Tax=Shimia sagamensis TaxID=1566352 RepID=A0ABY1NMM7_9RHOB|nr:DUF1499 domain-containing protein [Shimia sagamensis]SMP13454.1 Protein of unknown function [Shimia sagamensis]
MNFLWLVPILAIGFVLYVRLAPSDPARWHKEPQIAHDSDTENSARRLVMSGRDGLARFHQVAVGTPRTTALAGSVEAGMVTYVTRSKTMAYPDYTTAYQDGDMLKVYGRSRFGRRDFGVNGARVDGWIDAL